MAGALFAGRIPPRVPVERTAIAPLRRVSSLHSVLRQEQYCPAPRGVGDSTQESNSPNPGERCDLQEGEGQARADHDNGQAQADRGAAPVSKRAFHDVSPLVTPDRI